MLAFVSGSVLGFVLGVVSVVVNLAANDRTVSACSEAYEAGKRDACEKANCPAWECWVEAGKK